MGVSSDSEISSFAGPNLSAGDIHIWQIPLSGHELLLPSLRRLLSQDEIQRADRFYFDRDRQSFTVARAATRQVLGRYVNLSGETLAFSYGDKGKPELVQGAEGAPIKFNLSHSGEFALLAVTRGLCLGVDIERVNVDFAGEDIAERFFSRNEVAALRAIAAEARAESFFSCWTRKEAYIKALGEGLSAPLDSFDVAFGPGVPAALLSVRVSPNEIERWSLYDIVAPPGYKAALVAEGKQHRLRYLQWEPDPATRTP
jgi:4'-phosphopantetheinyl transferase